jgi:hypothetical protein
MGRTPTELESAVETFVRGFAVGRSQTHPYTVERVERIWRLSDAPRKNARDYRNEEWVAGDVAPAEVDRAARERSRGKYIVCAITRVGEDDSPLRAAYKQLGYRLMVTEPLFIHQLKRIPRAAAPAKIVRVTNAQLAEALGKTTRSRPIPTKCFGANGPFRQYVALDGDDSTSPRIVGWVRSIPVGVDGIGKAMLAKMLRDDRKFGVKRSVLTASHAGALLYPRLGYEQIGLLLAFVRR